MNVTKYFCQGCEKELKPNQRPCPICGCNRVFKIEVRPEDKTKIYLSYGVKQKQMDSDKVVKEILQGSFSSNDKAKHPKGVEKLRIIDRKNDTYHEKVIDAKTGKIVRDIKEPLSKHRHNKKQCK